MLEPWIIEEIRRREEEERQERERPQLRIEIEEPPPEGYPDFTPPAEEGERGVCIIQL